MKKTERHLFDSTMIRNENCRLKRDSGSIRNPKGIAVTQTTLLSEICAIWSLVR